MILNKNRRTWRMFLEMKFRSTELKKDTRVNILIPDHKDEGTVPFKTLWLLHGLSGDYTSWIQFTSIERYASKRNLAVIMPDANRSWYTNTAYQANYLDYIAKELPVLCRNLFNGMSDKREDQIVAGLSMGGYGALKLALTFPEQYGSCISLSGSLDITRKGRACNLNEWKSIFGFDLQSPLDLEGTEHDLFALTEKNHREETPFPKLYLWCGLEDPLIEINRTYDQFLTDRKIPHSFESSQGNHSWEWWDLHIQGALDWILTE